MTEESNERKHLRRLVVVAAVGLTLLGAAGALLILSGKKAGAWPLLVGDLCLTLTVLGLAWRNLR